MLDAEKLRRHILEDLDILHDLILRYAAGDKSVKLARDWLEAQVWREIEVLGRMEADQAKGARSHRSFPFLYDCTSLRGASAG